MTLFQIKIEIPPDSVETVDSAFLELGLEGWSVLEDVIAKRAWAIGIFQSEAELAQRWGELQSCLPTAQFGVPERSVLAEKDWRDSYKAHFKAWQFGRLHWVPVWERTSFVPPPGDAVLWLDPGLAFGTGNHETTRLCVERLVALASEGKLGARVVDAGCGSGILALSAALLGFREIVGFDNDAEAVRVSEENSVLNELQDRVKFFPGDLVSGLVEEKADVLLANILADVLVKYAGELTRAVAPGGSLVLSGILATECATTQAAFSAIVPDWKIESRTMGDWSDLLLRRP